MAYKESNPGVTQVILFIVLISLMLLIHVVFSVLVVNLFVEAMDPSDIAPIGIMASLCSLYNLVPLTFLYAFAVFGIAMYRRGVYGEAHEKATLAALLVSIIGPIVPLGIFIISFTFEKWYYATPFLLHLIAIMPFIAMFIYVKDVGGKVQSATGLAIYSVGTLMLVGIETFAAAQNTDMKEETLQLITALAVPWTIVLIVGIIFFLIGFVKALAWVKAHKPKIDEEQAQQISMQKEQITMQIRSLEMQKQQLEMQEKTLSLLGDIRSDQLIDSGRELIPEKSKSTEGGGGAPTGSS